MKCDKITVNDVLETIVKKVAMVYFKILFWHFCEVLRIVITSLTMRQKGWCVRLEYIATLKVKERNRTF